MNADYYLAAPLHAMEAFGGERKYSSYSFTTSALDGVEWSASPRPRFSPGERTPRYHCTGDSVRSTAGLDREARGKILSPLPRIEPRSPGRPQATTRDVNQQAGCCSCQWSETVSLNWGHEQHYRATMEWYCQEKTEGTRKKTCHSATVSTTDLTQTDQDVNPTSEMSLASNRLSYGTAISRPIRTFNYMTDIQKHKQ
jgi:hypothetical protein